jgi:hypothetical protein
MAILDKSRLGRGRRVWSAPSRARDVQTAALFCSRVLIPKANARNAVLSFTPANNAPTLTRPRALNACSRFPNAFPARIRKTIAGFTNFAPPSKKIPRRLLRKRAQPLPPSTFRALVTPARRLRIYLKSNLAFHESSGLFFPRNSHHLCLQPHTRIVILNLPMRQRITPRVAPSFRYFPGKVLV